jgi:hypothetical protein
MAQRQLNLSPVYLPSKSQKFPNIYLEPLNVLTLSMSEHVLITIYDLYLRHAIIDHHTITSWQGRRISVVWDRQPSILSGYEGVMGCAPISIWGLLKTPDID